MLTCCNLNVVTPPQPSCCHGRKTDTDFFMSGPRDQVSEKESFSPCPHKLCARMKHVFHCLPFVLMLSDRRGITVHGFPEEGVLSREHRVLDRSRELQKVKAEQADSESEKDLRGVYRGQGCERGECRTYCVHMWFFVLFLAPAAAVQIATIDHATECHVVLEGKRHDRIMGGCLSCLMQRKRVIIITVSLSIFPLSR